VEKLITMPIAGQDAGPSEEATDKKSRREEFLRFTITVTSLVAFIGIMVTPIINPLEVAFVTVNKINDQLLVVRKEICSRKIMRLSSYFDHCFVDGHDTASFNQAEEID
jgi:2-oxoisovalerate dehydrogenase E2 component (dihydrolipoyl transacylase)